MMQTVNVEFANISDGREDFVDANSLNDRGKICKITVDCSWSSCTNTSKDSF